MQGKGIVDESAFEVRLVGGLAVLGMEETPLYTMQSVVNLASLVALGWTWLLCSSHGEILT